MKYIMGTAQLGVNYGINNHAGKPDTQTALNMLDYAWNLGVRTLDTASAYGDAELLIGRYQKTTGNFF